MLIVLEFFILPFMSSYVRGIIQILNKLMNENILNGNLDLIHLMKLRPVKICTVYNKNVHNFKVFGVYDVLFRLFFEKLENAYLA